ncbi:kinase-like domain-containing protein [Xylariaceae sp. FL0662B]|nr:kinase-like domain-containing protein [Xylariaceae sp. FL0662B]
MANSQSLHSTSLTSETSDLHDILHDSDEESDTESVDEYELSFDERLPKIRELCEKVWPDVDHDKTEIEEIKGGGWNKIFAITISKGDVTQQYILRIPRVDFDLKQSAPILKDLWHRTQNTLTVPELIHSDSTDNNPLNYPYMILSRIPGRNLADVYPNLSHSQKLVVSRKLGVLYRQMHSITNPRAGLMRAPSEDDEASGSFTSLTPFGLNTDSMIKDDQVEVLLPNDMLTRDTLRKDLPGLSTKDILLLTFTRRKLYSTYCDFKWELDIEEQAIEVILDMAEDGLLDDNTICLWHTDLFPRNIMVDVETNPEDPIITGVIDWDDAAFAPRFVASRPPDWLWDSEAFKSHNKTTERGIVVEGEEDNEDKEEDNDDTESGSDEEPLEAVQPQTSDALEIKETFDSSAGEAYIKGAYEPRFAIARRLLRHSLFPQWEYDILEKLEAEIDHWKALKAADCREDGNTSDLVESDDEEGTDEQPKLENTEDLEFDQHWKYWIYFLILLLVLLTSGLFAFSGIQSISEVKAVETCNILVIHVYI